MQLPRRRLVICLSIAALCIAGWVRSYYHADTVFHSRGQLRTGLGLHRGGIAAFSINFHHTIPDEDAVPAGLLFRGPKLTDSRFAAPLRGGVLGFVLHRSPRNDPRLWMSSNNTPLTLEERTFRRVGNTNRYAAGGYLFFHELNTRPDGTAVSATLPSSTTRIGGWIASGGVLKVPFWFLGLASIAPLVLPALFRRLRPIPPHLCPACGYDLRATPDSCPECGRGAAA